jgi:hypothetical protein
MFEDFRKQSDDDSLFEEHPEQQDQLDSDIVVSRSKQHFLGMTPPQRFVIAVMLLMMTCILGMFCLLVTEKVVPPFLG